MLRAPGSCAILWVANGTRLNTRLSAPGSGFQAICTKPLPIGEQDKNIQNSRHVIGTESIMEYVDIMPKLQHASRSIIRNVMFFSLEIVYLHILLTDPDGYLSVFVLFWGFFGGRGVLLRHIYGNFIM